MLLLATSLREVKFSQLMAVYAQSNRENAREFYSQLPEELAVGEAEQDFYQYLKEVFFPTRGAVYAIWEVGGCYVSALRLEPYKDGLLLSALETAPGSRQQGYAKALLAAVLPGKGKVYSHVGKKNVPSLRVHESCGFQIVSERATYIDGSVNSRCYTLFGNF